MLVSGCDTVGAVGGLVARNIPRHIDAAYKGMADQTVIVMVWMDRGLKADYPDLQQDIASGLQGKLIKIAQEDKPDCLKGTVFPVMASTVIRNQENHPEWDNEAITDNRRPVRRHTPDLSGNQGFFDTLGRAGIIPRHSQR